MNGELIVRWEGIVVGTLRVNRQNQLTFQYAAEWLQDAARPALSISLPKRPEPFRHRHCRPFFAGLLPEEMPRQTIARMLGISEGNDFGFLAALGGDVAGALTLSPDDGAVPSGADAHAARALDDTELVELLDILPTRPLLAGRNGLRLSLAGAQSKLPVVVVDRRVALPSPGQPTTHILKTPIARLTAMTENEALVMKLAAATGLPVAPVEARVTGGRPYLLVTRYDRRRDADRVVRRLHQEDFCQALGVPPERKYAAEGGPTLDRCFDLLRRAVTQPAVATLALLDAVIFNVIVGNADAHGKNFSLLYDDGGTALAPLYDLVCTAAYEQLTPRFAMRVGRASRLEEITPETWPLLAQQASFTPAYVRRRVRELLDAVPKHVDDIVVTLSAASLDRAALQRYATIVADRAKLLARTVS
jgi:serine/threonine-protein kinase HipA